MSEYDWDELLLETFSEIDKPNYGSAYWLHHAFDWHMHPFGDNFWYAQHKRLVADKPLTKKAQTEIDKMIAARKAYLADQADKPLNPKAIEGRKKRQYHYIPLNVLDEIADGMAEGARKYGAFNWRQTKIEMSDYYNSTIRHLNAWFSGQDIDPDSGIHHLSKAITGLVVVRDAIAQESCIDDRAITNLRHLERTGINDA